VCLIPCHPRVLACSSGLAYCLLKSAPEWELAGKKEKTIMFLRAMIVGLSFTFLMGGSVAVASKHKSCSKSSGKKSGKKAPNPENDPVTKATRNLYKQDRYR